MIKISGRVKQLFQAIPYVNDIYTRWKWRERIVSYGEENADKTFYVIRRATSKVGLFSHVLTNIGQLELALNNGYIPVIDMQNNRNTYLEEDQIGRINAWEMFFEQPCSYSLKDISESKNVILGCGILPDNLEYPSEKMLENKDEFFRWHNICRKYLKVNKEIDDEADRLFQQMFGGERVLGILCRGTDYVKMKPHGHPIQPTPEQMIEQADRIIEEYQCRWIYLATEDEEYYQVFSNYYKDKLKVTRARRCNTDGNINDVSYERENDKYLKGKEYLINILLLSKCNCFLAGMVNGTWGALLLSDGFEYEKIFNLGIYE